MSEAAASERVCYSRDKLLEFRNQPHCRELPPGLEADDLSDLAESSFFDKTPSASMYLGPQGVPHGASRHAAAFGMGRGRPPGFGAAAPGSPAAIHSRLVEDGALTPPDRAGLNRAPSGPPPAFAASPTKGVPIHGRVGRYEDPSKMDRWDSRKVAQPAALGNGPGSEGGPVGKARGEGFRGHTSGADGGARGGGWGADRQQSGSAPKDGGGGRWGKDADDWRARKQGRTPPEPRYDWTDRAQQQGTAAAGATGRGPPPGFGGGGKRAGGGTPAWAAEDGGSSLPMTAQDIEAERQRMQAEWRRNQEAAGKGRAGSGVQGHNPETQFVDDDDIEAWKREAEEEDEAERQAAAPALARPVAGQQVDVQALFGGSAKAAAGPPQEAKARSHEEKARSRFATFFSMDESPAAQALPASGAGAGAPSPPPPQQQQQQQQQPAPPPAANAGKTLLAMLQKQGAEARLLGQVESVATDIALQAMDDERQQRPPPASGGPPQAPAAAAVAGQGPQGPPPVPPALPPGMMLPPGAPLGPPPHPGSMLGLPPGMHPPGSIPGMPFPGGGMPPLPGSFPPGMRPVMQPHYPGMLPPGAMPTGMPPMQYRPPGVGMPAPPSMGAPPPHPGQPNPLLAQLMAAARPQQQQYRTQQQQQQQQQMDLNALLAGGGMRPGQGPPHMGQPPPPSGAPPPGMAYHQQLTPAQLQQLQALQSRPVGVNGGMPMPPQQPGFPGLQQQRPYAMDPATAQRMAAQQGQQGQQGQQQFAMQQHFAAQQLQHQRAQQAQQQHQQQQQQQQQQQAQQQAQANANAAQLMAMLNLRPPQG